MLVQEVIARISESSFPGRLGLNEPFRLAAQDMRFQPVLQVRNR